MTNFLKRLPLFEVLLVAAILSTHWYAAQADPYAFPNVWFKRDDAYYYFKVAQNIAEGNGSTFDGINLTNGYHPLWMLINIPIFSLAKQDLILPLRVLVMVIAAIHAATAVLLYHIVKRRLSLAVAMLAASVWAFNFTIHETVYKMGLETPIAALTIMAMVFSLSRFEDAWRKKDILLWKIAGFALLAAFVMFSRLDLVFLAVLIGPWLILRGSSARHLLLLDVTAIFIAVTSAVILRTDFNAYNTDYSTSALEVAGIGMVVNPILLYFFGAYQHPRSRPLLITARQTALALGIGTLILFGAYLLLMALGLAKSFPRSAFLLEFVISLVLILAIRLAAYWFGNSNPAAALAPMSEFKSNWERWVKESAVYYGILGGLLGAYMIFNKVMFGTSTPVSGQIKRWWGSMPITIYEGPPTNWLSFFGLGIDHFETLHPLTNLFWWAYDNLRPILPGADRGTERYYLAMLVFFAFAAILTIIGRRRTLLAVTNMGMLPLAVGAAVHILSYTASSYGGAKEWYWVSQMILVMLVCSFWLDLLLKPLQRFKYAHIALAVGALWLGVSMWQSFDGSIRYVMRHNRYAKMDYYMRVVQILQKRTPRGSIIGMTGGGNVGYFIRNRTIVNMDGLINSYEYSQVLQAGTAPQYLQERGMTIVFANPRLLALPPYNDQFTPYFEKFSSFGGKDLLYLLEEPIR
jgi:hypothetical protein